MIRGYTREAGVRELERAIGRVARKRAREVVDSETPVTASIERGDLATLLGPQKFKPDQEQPAQKPGVAAGLAWTEAGGDVLYVEATLTPKDEKLTLTGHLGQVMQESARAARSHLWSAADALGIEKKLIEDNGVHIHVPAGAVPKDGPSAGVTMATALYSAYTGRPLPDDLAMTGELTLSGLVLPVGGIKEKLLAAHRAGKHRVIVPADNESDLAKLPETVRQDLEVILVRSIEEVLDAAFPSAE
jgi:ATP-dependent Lon protease